MIIIASELFQLNEEQKRSLEALLTSSESGLCQRASIILAYSDLQNMAVVASMVGVSEKSVSKWVGRYRAAGIEGLRVIHPGRSTSQKEATEQTSKKIHELYDSGSVSVREISDELGVNISSVYRAVKRAGLSTDIVRHTKWMYTTVDLQVGNSPYLAGVYLSYGVKYLVICESPEELKGKTIHGNVITRNVKLYKELEQSASSLRMVDTVVASKSHLSFSHAGKGIEADQFLTETIDSWPEESGYRFSIYAVGVTRYTGMRMQGIRFYWSDDIDSWMTQILSRYVGISHTEEYNVVSNDLRILQDYITALTPDSEPYAWRMVHGDYSPLATVLNTPAESVEVTDGIEDLERALKTMFPDGSVTSHPAAGTQVHAVICMQDSDGQFSYRTVSADALFPDINEESIGTEEGFDRTINELDRQMTSLSRKVNFAGRDLYLTNVKKTDTP